MRDVFDRCGGNRVHCGGIVKCALRSRGAEGAAMMHETMGSGMSWAMGVGAILVLAIVLLLTAALIKYLFLR